jgi:hypothetical protein
VTKRLTFAGYTFDAGPDGTVIQREYVKITDGDYGADPLEDGTFRMVPSGDIVDAAERDRRLGKA